MALRKAFILSWENLIFFGEIFREMFLASLLA